MHAKAETIDRLPSFAETFCKRRGLVYVSSFNVGEELPNGRVKQWTLTRPERAPMALAVIWKEWQLSDGEILQAYVMVTVAANELIAPKTDRMPAIIAPKAIPLWLGEDRAPLEEVKDLCQPFAGELFLTDPKPPKPPKDDGAFKRQKQTQNSLF
jgi:putative SOS response-associated peptidase YedK